ncbi:hypothetical protein ACQZV8_03205 [Magnetococcales bacterium HHB-1]
MRPTPIPLNKIEPGMVVSADVLDRSGRLLLGKETAITKRHLRIFKTWGITEIEIKTDPIEDAPPKKEETTPQEAIPKKIRTETLQWVKDRFQHIDLTIPAAQQLFKICFERKLQAAKKEYEQS